MVQFSCIVITERTALDLLLSYSCNASCANKTIAVSTFRIFQRRLFASRSWVSSFAGAHAAVVFDCFAFPSVTFASNFVIQLPSAANLTFVIKKNIYYNPSYLIESESSCVALLLYIKYKCYFFTTLFHRLILHITMIQPCYNNV